MGTDLGDGHGVIDLSEATLDDDRVLPKVRVMAMQQHKQPDEAR
ncbi:hypothetical protein [Streptomyces katrae]|nr:hypothetical protein [Streptomyces katrae]